MPTTELEALVELIEYAQIIGSVLWLLFFIIALHTVNSFIQFLIDILFRR